MPKLLPLVLATLLANACVPERPPCSDTKLAAIVAECRLRAERECKDLPPGQQCPVFDECDKRIDAWEVCR